MSRKARSPAALAVVALIGTGCGSTSPSNAGDTGTPRAKAVRFSECMRANGISAFPDPDASGGLTIDGIANGSSVDPNSAMFKKALSACRDLQPPGFTGHKRGAQQQQTALRFARCIRDNGVRDFPDPTSGAPLVDTNRIPSSATSGGMTILNAAMHKCGAVYAGELGLQGP